MGEGVGEKGQTASLHHLFPDKLGVFPMYVWTGASVSRVTRTIISRLGRGILKWTKIRRR